MTIKELIKKLQQIENQDANVVIKGTDPTDWVYHNDIESIIYESNTIEDDDSIIILDNEDLEDYDKEDIKPLCIINAGFF
jgi:hypothetical protein